MYIVPTYSYHICQHILTRQVRFTLRVHAAPLYSCTMLCTTYTTTTAVVVTAWDTSTTLMHILVTSLGAARLLKVLSVYMKKMQVCYDYIHLLCYMYIIILCSETRYLHACMYVCMYVCAIYYIILFQACVARDPESIRLPLSYSSCYAQC
jgi:hypothetical protein